MCGSFRNLKILLKLNFLTGGVDGGETVLRFLNLFDFMKKCFNSE